jgi:2-oxoglutarate ferredoxin oxidoreductase subunit alpha
MGDKIFIDGNEAIARGAIAAKCQLYAGYPITPQSEIGEFMSGEFPKLGKVFIQAEDEIAAIFMVEGASVAGDRAMTSTSSLGFSLMSEGISHMSSAEMPGVVVNVMRLGPGAGTIQEGQTDYRQATKGGGHGGYRCIVLAPCSVQECFDLTQLAFYLADKYRMPVVLLSSYLIGHMAEGVELSTKDCGPLPEKDYILTGTANRSDHVRRIGGLSAFGMRSPGVHESITKRLLGYKEKHQRIAESEIRYDSYQADDAQLLVVAFGSTSRMAKEAVRLARIEGIKAGLLRPITLWPFPGKAIKEAALRAGKVLVVEDNNGQMLEDVECAIQGHVAVRFLGIEGRNIETASGLIHPERIVQEMKSIL